MKEWKQQAIQLHEKNISWRQIARQLGKSKSTVSDFLRNHTNGVSPVKEKNKPKILILDIETAPLLSHTWGLFKQNVGLNQIQQDWFLLSWSAKWLEEEDIFYRDQSFETDIEDDKVICAAIRNLINQADMVVAHNGKKFDIKKLNARFILNGLPPVKPVRIIDTLEIAKQEFGFTSNKLAYLTDKLCTKYKKLEHSKFPGHSLWVEVLKGNQEAWDEMREYNIHDVLGLEELYLKLRSWSSKHPSTAIYGNNDELSCRICGSEELTREGEWRTGLSVFPLYQCECGAWNRGRNTSTTKEERKTLGMAPV